jgi:hypothetical protein
MYARILLLPVLYYLSEYKVPEAERVASGVAFLLKYRSYLGLARSCYLCSAQTLPASAMSNASGLAPGSLLKHLTKHYPDANFEAIEELHHLLGRRSRPSLDLVHELVGELNAKVAGVGQLFQYCLHLAG